MKWKVLDLGWWDILGVLGLTVVFGVVFGLVGSALGAEARTASWFVVGAVLSVGLELSDQLREIHKSLEHMVQLPRLAGKEV